MVTHKNCIYCNNVAEEKYWIIFNPSNIGNSALLGQCVCQSCRDTYNDIENQPVSNLEKPLAPFKPPY